MNLLTWPAKFSDEVLDYELDWTPGLAEGETIVGDPVITATHGVTVETQPAAEGVTRVRLAGGAGVESIIDMLATTSSGQKVGARMHIAIRQR